MTLLEFLPKVFRSAVVFKGAITIGATVLSATAAELNKLAGVVAGTVTASKALVVDANKALDTLVVATLKLGAGAGTAITATAAELNVLASVVAGAVSASKGLVVDANKDLAQLRNLRAVRTIHDGGTPASIATVGAGTYTAANLLTGIIVRDPNGSSRTDTLDTAANLVAAVPGATVGDTLSVTVINGADAAEVITIAAGSGGGFDANQTATARVIGQNSSKTLRIRLTNVTGASEAYVVYC
jgi:hypothetical protein